MSFWGKKCAHEFCANEALVQRIPFVVSIGYFSSSMRVQHVVSEKHNKSLFEAKNIKCPKFRGATLKFNERLSSQKMAIFDAELLPAFHFAPCWDVSRIYSRWVPISGPEWGEPTPLNGLKSMGKWGEKTLLIGVISYHLQLVSGHALLQKLWDGVHVQIHVVFRPTLYNTLAKNVTTMDISNKKLLFTGRKQHTYSDEIIGLLQTFRPQHKWKNVGFYTLNRWIITSYPLKM